MGQILILLQTAQEMVLSDVDATLKIALKLFIRLFIDIAAVIFLISVVYFPSYKKSDLNFTFFVFNIVIFLVCFLLNKVDLSMGAAFGLFAVFSMLRYRTEEISIKDMTYLFLVIAIGLISAVTKIKDAGDFYEYIFIAGILSVLNLLALTLERNLIFRTESTKTIVYENISLLHASKRADLLQDLRTKTGLDIRRFAVIKVDYVNDSAIIKVYYSEPGV